MDIEEILKRHSTPTTSVRISTDPDLLAEYRKVEREANRAMVRADASNDRDLRLEADELRRRVEDLRTAIEDSTVEFVFRGLGRVAYNELVEQHPPSAEDRAKGFEFDPETFGPLLLAACSVEPEINEDQANRIWTEWTDAEVVKLFNAAYESNKVVRDVPFTGDDSGRTKPSGPNSGSVTASE